MNTNNYYDILMREILKEQKKMLNEASWSTWGVVGATGLGVGGYALYRAIRRWNEVKSRLEEERSKCATEECKKRVDEKLRKEKAKIFGVGVVKAVAGTAIGGATGLLGSKIVAQPVVGAAVGEIKRIGGTVLNYLFGALGALQRIMFATSMFSSTIMQLKSQLGSLNNQVDQSQVIPEDNKKEIKDELIKVNQRLNDILSDLTTKVKELKNLERQLKNKDVANDNEKLKALLEDKSKLETEIKTLTEDFEKVLAEVKDIAEKNNLKFEQPELPEELKKVLNEDSNPFELSTITNVSNAENKKNFRTRVSILIFDKNLRLLVGVDPFTKIEDKKFIIPGGTNEEGESLEKTAIREASEEVGVKIKNVKILKKFTKNVSYKHVVHKRSYDGVINYIAVASFDVFLKNDAEYDRLFLSLRDVVDLLEKKRSEIKPPFLWLIPIINTELKILKKFRDYKERQKKSIVNRKTADKTKKYIDEQGFLFQYPIRIKYLKDSVVDSHLVEKKIEWIKTYYKNLFDIIYHDLKTKFSKKITFERDEISNYLSPIKLVFPNDDASNFILTFHVNGSDLDGKSIYVTIDDDCVEETYVV